ncbi:MAG: hypothetical protein JW981_06770, partial [Anaerolineae bacterium]|nr:hypothetical protein [Anaerolineae bacterium]
MKKKTVPKSWPSFSRRQFLYLVAGSLGAAATGCTDDNPDLLSGQNVELPPYIDGGMGIPVFRGPYLQSSVTIAGFMLPAKLAPLRDLCDHYLNTPALGNLSYVPLAPVVLLLFADMDIASLDHRD